MAPVRWAAGLTGAARRVGWSGAAASSGQGEGDRGLIRAYAILRVLVGFAIVIGGMFVTADDPDTRLWLIIVAAGWIPASLLILIITFRARSRAVLIVGPLADLVMLATAQGLLHQGIGLTACYPIIAAFAAYTSPGIPIFAVGGFTLALALIVQSQLPESQRFSAAGFGLFAVLVIGVLLIVERSTARSRGAQELAARARSRADVVLAAVGSAVVVTDAQSRVVTANPAADRLLGASEPISGRQCSAVLGLHVGERRLDCDTGCQLLALAQQGPHHAGAPIPDATAADLTAPDLTGHDLSGPDLTDLTDLGDFEAWREGEDGGRQPLLVTVQAVPASEGPGLEVVHSIRDITRLKQADEAKTLFLATASHELKTPLTVINGFAKTLTTRSLPPEKQREALAAIRRRGEELARVVDRLLLSSRIEAGRTDVAHTPVDLIPLLYERAAELAEATDRLIDVDLPDDLPWVLGDSSAIVTVVDHLLDNAVKYSPDGEPVLVRAAPEPLMPSTPALLELEITDAGVGMDPTTVRHCFDKFWQADASGTRRFGGTGIGLYIVRSLVEAMGGTIAVRSAPGSGSTFTVRFPIAQMGQGGPVVPAPLAGDATPAARRRSRLPRFTRPDVDTGSVRRD